MKKSLSRQPLVSIVVPNYNHAIFLRQRIDSILAQEYPNHEVIILDDHSSDNSMEVISKYANHPKVSLIISNDTNSGSPFVQWKRGLAEAKGEIVWIAESDDYCKPSFLSNLVETYIRNNCVLAFTRSMIVDVDGHEKGVCQRHFFHHDHHWDGKKFIRHYLSVGNRIVNASSAIFSKKAAMKIDKRFMDFKESGDWLFWIEIARQGNVAVVSEPLNFFRRSSQTNTSKATLAGKTDIEDKTIFEYLRENGLMPRFKAFNKQKRMATRLLYHHSRFANDAIRKSVMEAWHLPRHYYILAKASHCFHYTITCSKQTLSSLLKCFHGALGNTPLRR